MSINIIITNKWKEVYLMSKALLLIDIQNDYFPDGAMELNNVENAAKQARKVLELFRENHDTIIHIQHLSVRKDATFFLPNTKGCEIHEWVTPLEKEILIQKNWPNSFRKTSLLEMLEKHQIKELTICGMMSHMCIDSTIRAAFDLGFSCKVLHDACATKDLEWNGYLIESNEVHHTIMASLQGLFADVISTQDYIKENKGVL